MAHTCPLGRDLPQTEIARLAQREAWAGWGREGVKGVRKAPHRGRALITRDAVQLRLTTEEEGRADVMAGWRGSP